MHHNLKHKDTLKDEKDSDEKKVEKAKEGHHYKARLHPLNVKGSLLNLHFLFLFQFC